MRAVHVLSSLDPRNGGPSYALLGLVKAQRAAGIDASITATHYWDISNWAEYNRLIAQGCPITALPFRPWSLKQRGVGRLHEFTQQLSADIRNSDIVHIHGLWQPEQRLAANLARQFQTPFIFRPCGMLAPWSMQQSRWKKQIYLRVRLNQYLKQASAIHFTTKREKRMSQTPNANSAIVEPNGIDAGEYADLPEEGSFRRKFAIAPTTRVVLFLGRIHHKKGIRILIQAFANVDAGMLVIAGPDDTEHSTDLRQLCEQLGVSNRVLFTGPLYGEDRAAAFQDADVFALTSFHENFGNTVIESLACGTPVVVSDQVDVCEDLVGTAVCDVVSLDVDFVTKCLQNHIKLPKTKSISEQCRKVAFRKFDWSEIGSRWQTHYDKLVMQHRMAIGHEPNHKLSAAS